MTAWARSLAFETLELGVHTLFHKLLKNISLGIRTWSLTCIYSVLRYISAWALTNAKTAYSEGAGSFWWPVGSLFRFQILVEVKDARRRFDDISYMNPYLEISYSTSDILVPGNKYDIIEEANVFDLQNLFSFLFSRRRTSSSFHAHLCYHRKHHHSFTWYDLWYLLFLLSADYCRPKKQKGFLKRRPRLDYGDESSQQTTGSFRSWWWPFSWSTSTSSASASPSVTP